MKNKEPEWNKMTDYKQELIDIYKLTFYQRPSISPFPKDEQKKRKLSSNRKAGSVKEILQEYKKQTKDQFQLQPIKQNKFQRILYQDTKEYEKKQTNDTDRSSISKTTRRYRSVNLTKKFQYLQRNIGIFETSDNQYQSNRLSNYENCENINVNKWISQQQQQYEQSSQVSDFYHPRFEQPQKEKLITKKLIFPKEFSANGLYKKYFA